MAVELSILTYEFTAEFPREEIYGLTSQLRRAAVSIASNIAEGSSRGTWKDFRQFVKLAKGSNSELQTQLLIARRLGFGDTQKCERAEAPSQDVSRMLSGLSKFLTAKVVSDRKKTDNR
jgi:four helix bundle protein